MGGGHEVLDGSMPNGCVLRLPLGMDLQERPRKLLVHHTSVKLTEGIKHPCLLVVGEVLDGEVVPKGVRALLHNTGRLAARRHDVAEHRLEGLPRQLRGGVLPHELLQGLAHQGLVELREELPVRFCLRLAIVHAILPSERLDEVFKGIVTPHIIGLANPTLDLEQHSCEEGIEGLKVVSKLPQDWAKLCAPRALIKPREQGIEPAKSGDRLATIKLGLKFAKRLAVHKLRK
mmetsp:Transcript_40261/g.95660  ORF Transcript_40261/g.95660 Transcript_40261/m.95660 type:complete len:232 (+) Transcript_40261:1262-1957(+)